MLRWKTISEVGLHRGRRLPLRPLRPLAAFRPLPRPVVRYRHLLPLRRCRLRISTVSTSRICRVVRLFLCLRSQLLLLPLPHLPRRPRRFSTRERRVQRRSWRRTSFLVFAAESASRILKRKSTNSQIRRLRNRPLQKERAERQCRALPPNPKSL